MDSRQRFSFAGLAVCLYALVLAWPGAHGIAEAAEPHGVISSVTVGRDALDVRFNGADLQAEARLQRDSVRVLLDGEEIDASARQLAARRDPEDARRVVLVVDTSGSMAGAPLNAARASAKAYLAAVPRDVEVGLISFAEAPRVLVAPTTDRRRVGDALPGLRAVGGTGLYDAVLQAQQTLGTRGERRILVLSDGADSASRATLDRAAAAVRDAGTDLDAVALGPQAAPAVAVLTRLSATGDGRLLRAVDGAEAVAAFQTAAEAFSAGLQLHVPLPAGTSAGPAVLKVEASTDQGQQLRATSPVVLPEVAGSGPNLLSSTTALTVGLLAVFCGLSAALVLGVRAGDTQALGRRRAHQVLASYTLGSAAPEGAKPPASRIGDSMLARAALAIAGRVVARGQYERRLTALLECAAVRLTAREWVVVQATIALTVGAVLLLLHLVVAVLGAGLAAAAAHFWLSLKASRRTAAFEDEMPDALQLVSTGLSTGYSLAQALDSVVRDGRPPVSEEMGRALAEARLGIGLEDALDTVAERVDSQDFRWVVMAIRVQRDVGGNLSEVLRTVVHTMRERAALRRQVKALSAEGRMSALILVLLPVVLAGYLAFMNPDFFRPMYTTGVGQFLLIASVVSLGLGGLWMKKLVKVEM